MAFGEGIEAQEETISSVSRESEVVWLNYRSGFAEGCLKSRTGCGVSGAFRTDKFWSTHSCLRRKVSAVLNIYPEQTSSPASEVCSEVTIAPSIIFLTSVRHLTLRRPQRRRLRVRNNQAAWATALREKAIKQIIRWGRIKARRPGCSSEASSTSQLQTPRTPECFPAAPRDLFWQMDQVASADGQLQPLNFDENGDNVIDNSERDAIRGRNTWLLWGGGDETSGIGCCKKDTVLLISQS